MNDEKIPAVLYKYYPPARWENMCKDWTIRFTPIINFNDPFEACPYFETVFNDDFLKFAAKEDGGPVLSADEFHANMTTKDKKKLEDSIRKDFIIAGVFSLSLGRRKLLLWSHYAQSHEGFIVGFNMNSSFFTKDNMDCFSPAKKVLYKNKRPAIKSIADLVTSDVLNTLLYIKGRIWKYEQEYRIIATLESKKIKTINGVKGICNIPKQTICEIIFGISMPEKEIRNKCKYIYTQPDCAHIKLKRAELHKTQFKLVIKEIDPNFYV